jgi:hypothetical protein
LNLKKVDTQLKSPKKNKSGMVLAFKYIASIELHALTRRTNGFRNLSRFLQRNAKSPAKLLHRCAGR